MEVDALRFSDLEKEPQKQAGSKDAVALQTVVEKIETVKVETVQPSLVESNGVAREENRPVVRTLYRANTTTLGDMLDPTYMDPTLWSQMPMHLVELILSKVPFRNLVAMRRVCKYWNALILSDGFSPPFVPALIMFARTPTVRKMMWERNQPTLTKAKEHRRWSFNGIWSSVRLLFKRKRSDFP